MSSRKPGATATTAAVLEDTANTSATVILPACSEDQYSSAAEELARAGAKSPSPEGNGAGEKTEEQQQSSGDANPNPNSDRSQSSPATTIEGVVASSKPPTPTTVSDGLGSKSVRITRLSSPLLLLSSPTATASKHREASEDGEEPPSSGSQRKSSVERSVVAPPVIRGRKSIKDLKEAKEAIAKLEDGPGSGTVQVKEEAIDGSELESLPAADEKDNKDTKDKDKEKEKDKELPPTPTCNRVTRKSHAQEQANNTRVTRNRRQSSTVASSEQQQQQLPTARGRRARKSQAVVPPPLEPATKRNRSEDDVESAAKYSKIEVKAPPPEDEVDDAVDAVEEPPKGAVLIKQEPPDRDTATPVPVHVPAVPTPTSGGGRRGRGRPQTKNVGAAAGTAVSPAVASSTSTRATRLSKTGSPGGLGMAAAAEPMMAKRRRVGSTTRKTASAGSLATSSHGGGDEDSKDSMASSMDDLLLAHADIKLEKLTPDFDESLLLPVDPVVGLLKDAQTAMEEESSTTSGGANGHSSSSCVEPLTVDADLGDADKDKPKESPQESTELPESESESASGSVSACGESGKAPSLSPDIISVKFYKKFLANNLGIEKDPELGEIVQIASHSKVEVEAEAEAESEADPETELEAKTEVELELLKPESETEPEAEAEAEVKAAPAAEAEVEAEAKSALEDSSYSNSSLKAGALRLDESGEELPLEDRPADEVAVNGDDGHEGEAEDEEGQKSDNYDDFDHEIMEELAKEGVVDARGNALSRKAEDEPEPASKPVTETDPADPPDHPEGVPAVGDEEPTDAEEKDVPEGAMEVKASPTVAEQPADADTEMEMDVDMEQGAEPEEEEEPEQDKPQQELPLMADHMDNDFPEENKENLSMSSTSPRRSSHDGLDIQLTLKDEEDEEKPLATIKAAEQKTNLDPDDLAAPQLCLKALKDLKDHKDQSEEKALLLEYLPNAEANGKQEAGLSCDEKERRDQEIHLHNLGLLTHQAAEQRRQDLQEAQTRQAQYQQQHPQAYPSGKRRSTALAGAAAGSGSGSGSGGGSAIHVESSGTLKTVIKLNRSSNGGASGSGGVPTGTVIHGSGSSGSSSSSSMGSATRKASAASTGSAMGSQAHGVRRQSLKMTFQKGRARGHGSADRSADQHGVHAEDSYYTIQNENEGATKSNIPSGNPGRKTTNRFSSTNSHHHSTIAKHLGALQHRSLLDSSQSEGHGGHGMDHGFYQMVKKDEKEKILIPEKASSFKFHPGRLCEDQCYYCSGKFGLYDTPCHVGQIKSVERQQKILANEEKLTVDNCLCDACFRHVDRRANAAPYNKKRLSAPGHLETGGPGGPGGSASGSNLDKSYAGEGMPTEGVELGPSTSAGVAQRSCAVKDCCETAGHQLRRKCIRKSVKKFQLSFEIPAGTSIVWLCEAHYNTFIQFSGCVLCKRRLGKNHMYNITTDTDRLEKALTEMGIPVQLGMGTAVCKLCRYFANLLMKPPDSTKSQKAEFVKNYRKRLLKVHNLQDASNEVSEAEDEAVDRSAHSAASTSAAASTHEDAEMPLVVDFDGPTDSNSSSSSITAIGGSTTDTSKQISKLQAILQQNLAGEGLASGSGSGSGSGAANGSASSSAANPDISNVLRGNPNISMRELFHGEEEMGLQFKVPFGCSSSQRTPEGWTRVQTFLQYDEPTRRLWEELQKPYGNQSSFLRHLILLEKYYRNGDLVLGAHASSNASVYTETVRQRLNSFDHGHSYGGTPAGKRPPVVASPGSSSSLAASASGSVLATPIANANANQSADNTGQGEPKIPLVELNEDDDEVAGGQRSPKDVLNSHLERLTTVSVDKLTKQLSSNAVTIIARPKDKPAPPSTAATATGPATATVTAKTATLASSPASISSASPASSPEDRGAAAGTGTQKAVALCPSQFKNAPPLVPTSGANSRSILKSNLLGTNKAVEIVPLSSSLPVSASLSSASLLANHSAGSKAPAAVAAYSAQEKQNKILDVANKLLSSKNESKSQQQQQQVGARLVGAIQSKLKLATPMSLHQHQQQQASASKTPTNVAQLLNSPPELISLARRRTAGGGPPSASMAPGGSSLMGNQLSRRLQLQQKPGTTGSAGTGTGAGTGAAAGSRGLAAPPNVVILPETLTTQERHECKSWKPTLIPLEDQNHVPSKSQALYQTADGRRLPALVQVQSGGKPYLISIFDYNRMCILRREKLLRDQMLKTNAKPKPNQTQSQSGQNSDTSLPAYITQMAHQQQTSRQQLQQLQQQQQQQQHKQHSQQQMPTLQPGGGAGAGAGRLARLAPKPMPPLNIPQIASQGHPQLNINPSLEGTSGNSSNSSWLWNNFPDHKQYLPNGNGGTGPSGKLPHLTPSTVTLSSGSSLKSGPTFTLKQQQHQMQQQKLIDNAISKIPKSLIVIPQGGDSSGSSKE
ncbi:uncharacterized protein LOC108163645 isoform X2 [Drosophila miranda]|uniref:uncharacterized protein LOC108163645 isoform X2 n=1 Tax=Drosophila miranda TaxID=7229 RepID=UPI00143FB119|nr:uncharacterized protein LOC108163645 isoform X2 [Drosophila miranda]